MNRNPLPDVIDLASEPDFALGRLRVRPSLREVSVNGQVEMLEPRVMQVLVAIARQRGEVVSRDRLVERCWAGRAVGEDAVNRCIARIAWQSGLASYLAMEQPTLLGALQPCPQRL